MPAATGALNTSAGSAEDSESKTGQYAHRIRGYSDTMQVMTQVDADGKTRTITTYTAADIEARMPEAKARAICREYDASERREQAETRRAAALPMRPKVITFASVPLGLPILPRIRIQRQSAPEPERNSPTLEGCGLYL